MSLKFWKSFKAIFQFLKIANSLKVLFQSAFYYFSSDLPVFLLNTQYFVLQKNDICGSKLQKCFRNDNSFFATLLKLPTRL